jgi:hypothetical protein
MSPGDGVGDRTNGGDDARRAVVFMAVKFALFAILPVLVAVAVVAFTLPD